MVEYKVVEEYVGDMDNVCSELYGAVIRTHHQDVLVNAKDAFVINYFSDCIEMRGHAFYCSQLTWDGETYYCNRVSFLGQ